MRKKIILHIGRHKTGTTNIQLFLDHHREFLKEKGYCYPLSAKETGGVSKEDGAAHHLLAKLLTQPRSEVDEIVLQIKNSILREAIDCHTIILSSEGFQNLENPKRLTELFAEFDVHVICYLREYLSYVASSYAQEIKGSNLTIDFFYFEKFFWLQLGRFIQDWEEAASRCTWRLYDRHLLDGGDIVIDFIASLNLPVNFSPSPKDPNVTISGNLLSFKFLLNCLVGHRPEYGPTIEALANSKKTFRGKFFLDKETQDKLRRGNDCNELIRQRFGEITLQDFSDGNPLFHTETFRDDMKIILGGFSIFPEVVNHPIFVNRSHL